MTKNASDLFKAVVQHPLEKDNKPVARESAVVQDAGVNAPIPRNKLAVKPGKKAIHELTLPSTNGLESDPAPTPLESTNADGLTTFRSASTTPPSDPDADLLGTWSLDTLHAAQGDSSLAAYSDFSSGNFGDSYLLAQAATEPTSPATGTKETSATSAASSPFVSAASWAWFIPAALAGVGAFKATSSTSDTVTRLRVVDGPVKDAKVYVDLDGDGVIDDGEPEVGSTDSSGFATVTLTAEQAKHALLAKGGTDTETNKAFAGVLAAPAGSTVINPLTTLVAAMMEGGQSLSQAKTAVVTALGLTGVSDLTSYDTFAQASTPEGMANHLKAVQIANIIVAGAALAASDSSAAAQTGAASRVIDALASKMANTSGAVTFDAAVLTAVLTTAGATSHAASVAAAIASVNTLVANASGPDALTQVAQAQVLAQVTLSNAIKSAATGGLATVLALQDSTTAAQLAIQIDAKSTDTLAPTLAITSSAPALNADESATITFTFSEDPGASFAAGDVTVTGGLLGPVSGSGLTRTAIFTPTADLTGINATLAVGAAAYSDAVGNPGNAATALNIALETRTATSLVIQDGYLDGTEVWVDMNNTGKIDAGDYPLGLSEEGRVNGFLTAAQKGHPLIAQGGTDISTGLPFEGSYSATAGSTVVNPLTTLVQSIVKTELGDTSQLSPQEAIERMAQAKASAMAKVSEALDLPLGVDLTQIDTIASASAGQDDAAAGISLSQALDINSKALMVANLMAVGAAALKGSDNSTGADAPTLANLSDFIVGSIVQAMDTALASGSALTMDDSDTLTGILASAAQTATDTDSGLYSMDPTKLSNASAAVGTAVASTNSLIDTLTGNAKSAVRTDPQAAEDTLLRILAAQKAAMNQIADIKTGDSSKLLAISDNFSDAAAVQVQSQSVGLLRLGTTDAVEAPTQAAADSAAPQVVSVSVKPERVGELAQFVVLMSEGVLIKTAGPGLPSLAIQTTANGAPSEALLDLSHSGSDKLVFTYRIEPGDTQLAVLNGAIGLAPGSSIQDLSGKPALLSLAGGLVGFSAPQIDSLAPTVTVSARETFVQTGQSTLLTFSVSEAVAFAERSNAVHADAFGVEDITAREAGQVVRGRISEFKALGPSQGRYFFEALLTPGNSDAPTEVAVGAGRFTDTAGNPNLASNLVAVAQESVTPSIVVTAEQAAFNAQDKSISTSLFFTLSQDSSNFTADDVTVNGPGSLNNFTGSGRQYSAVLSGMDSST